MAFVERTTVESRYQPADVTSGLEGTAGFFLLEVLLLALVASLALVVHAHAGPLPGDVGGVRAVQDSLWGRGELTTMVEDVSTLSWPIPGAITIAVVTGLLLLLRQWLSALLIPLSVGVADGSNYLVSQLVKRPRPSGYGIHVAEQIKNYYSFPSGHVLYAVVFFGLLTFLAFRARHQANWLGIVIVLLLALIILMPISRLLEGEHWPSDVLASLLWGFFWLLAAIRVYRWAWVQWPALRRHIPEPLSPAPRSVLE